jgi:hypothetical protein
MFAFLAAHRAEVFPDEDFADLFPSGRGRPSISATVMAAALTLQTLYALVAALTPEDPGEPEAGAVACGDAQ